MSINDYKLAVRNVNTPTFSESSKEFCVQVATTCITLTTSISINYHTHNTSSSIDKYGPDKLSCHVPAVLITSRLID